MPPARLTRRTVLALSAVGLAHPFAALCPALAQSPTADAPIPLAFPRDDGPHDVLIEWWYFTGHLLTETSDRYGFEFVFFKADTGEISGLVSHFAITDNPAGTFHYDQHRFVGPVATPEPGSTGFDLVLDDWSMRGVNGNDVLAASMEDYAIDLTLTAAKPPALHDGDGYIDYGNGQATYYYSRTRIHVTGDLTVDSVVSPVTGQAWFDHQWGDFQTFQEGGWDWFALQLEDGTEVMLYVVFVEDGSVLRADGSVVDADGALKVLSGNDFRIGATGTWTSEATGFTYPSGWTVAVPSEALNLVLTPTLLDQELDTRATTGVIYWEGEVVVAGARGGDPVAGLGYVELTASSSRA